MKTIAMIKQIGKTAHKILNVTQLLYAPTRYTNKIPIVKNNWKNAPSAPRIDVSAISDTNIGATTHEAPVARP